MVVQKSTLFSEFYNPEDLLHRQTEAGKIDETFKHFHGNLFLSGGSGTGKTTTAKFIMRKYMNQYLYVSASEKLTTIKIFKALSDVPAKTFSSLLERFTESLINRPRVLIIDEVNKVYNLEHFFDALNTLYRATNIPIILISNKANLLDSMPQDAYLTLFFQRIPFRPYDALELRNIALQRISLMEDKVDFPDGVLRYICAKCASSGSARELLYLVYRCIVQKRFTCEFVDELEKEIKRQDWEQWLETLKDFEKRFLKTLLDIHAREVANNGSNGEIAVSMLQRNLSDLSPQRISQLITSFKEYGIIETRYVNQGKKGGRYRLVSFSEADVFDKISSVL